MLICFNTNLPPLQSHPTSYDEGMCSDLLCCNEEVEALILSLDLLVQMESQAEC